MLDQQYELFDQILRIVFLGLAPIVLIVLTASLAVSVVQSSLAIRNECLDLVVRLLAFILALYFFMPKIISALIELFTYAYNS